MPTNTPIESVRNELETSNFVMRHRYSLIFMGSFVLFIRFASNRLFGGNSTYLVR